MPPSNIKMGRQIFLPRNNKGLPHLSPRQRFRRILPSKVHINGGNKMKLKFIKSSEKRKLLTELETHFGITKLPYLLIEAGKEKIRAFSGHLSKEEISQLNSTINLEFIGLYLIKKETPIRISFDAPHLLNPKKNILSVDSEQAKLWLQGSDLEIKKPRGTYIISHNDNLIGLGKSNSEKILNHVPKDRRLKRN
jgi:NOL1/NOP2/fmu family ribosome biogenesis protein